MPTIKELDALNGEMTEWRHALHQKPEMAFEEEWTSDFIAEKLESFGIEIHRGLAKTGIVGVVRGKLPGNRAIGLRADMDALRIEEANTFTHRSQHPGIMHACGHDGHSAMLLGAARHLAENPDFAGTVYLIFQPAEENEGGARVGMLRTVGVSTPDDIVAIGSFTELVGEGGYEGLSPFMFETVDSEGELLFSAFIVPTDMLPAMPPPPAAGVAG